jgi:hypothetical protein
VFATTLSRKEMDVGDCPAVRFEVELTGQGPAGEGTSANATVPA